MRRLILWVVLLVAGCTPHPTTWTPSWTPWPPLRAVPNLGPVVSDVESHLPAGHPYRDADRITWTHEGTHGIAGRLRNHFRRPGFYVLGDRAIVLTEPACTLAAVAAVVPKSLRGRGYRLYLIAQQGYFNNQPTYVFDEWVAYTNGSEARQRLRIRDRGESVDSMMEFVPYALCVPYASRAHDPQMRNFIAWQIERAVTLSGRPCPTLRTAADAEALRQFTRTYFGPTWTRKTLGF